MSPSLHNLTTINQLEFRKKLAKELLEYSSVLHGGGRGEEKTRLQALVHHFVCWKQHQRMPVCGQVRSGSTCQESTVNISVGRSNAKNAFEPIVDA